MAVFFPDQDKEMSCSKCGNKTFRLENVYMLKLMSSEHYIRELVGYTAICNECGHKEDISKSVVFIDS